MVFLLVDHSEIPEIHCLHDGRFKAGYDDLINFRIGYFYAVQFLMAVK